MLYHIDPYCIDPYFYPVQSLFIFILSKRVKKVFESISVTLMHEVITMGKGRYLAQLNNYPAKDQLKRIEI